MTTSVSGQNIAIVILAAGSSSRLGEPKQLLEYQNKTLIKHAVETALQTSCQPVIVVSGFLHEEIINELKNFPVEIVHNLNWNDGIGSSISTGIMALNQLVNENSIDAVLIMLCDQPLITPAHLNLLIHQFYLDKNSMTATGFAETAGVPAIFDKSLFKTLETLPVDRGAQWLIKQHQNQLTIVPFEAAAVDVDTREDYLQLINSVNRIR